MNASDGTTRAVFLTGVAMLAFAGNSILCRLALRDGAIDPASFTSIRLVSGAVTLMIIFWITRRGDTPRAHGSWLSACVLFFYAICFSYAYITLSAGAGALILLAALVYFTWQGMGAGQALAPDAVPDPVLGNNDA